jgi:DNA-binding response OmpR family regulator
MADVPTTTVLVVDDDEAFVSRLTATLNTCGYCVLTATDVNQAFDILEREPVDLAIIDLDLPDKSGLELIHQATKGSNPIRVLATTGVLSDLHLEIAKYMGAQLAVRKFAGVLGGSFPDTEWIDTIARVMDERTNPA